MLFDNKLPKSRSKNLHLFRLPLFSLLLTPSDYIFFTIRTDGEREELYDESRSIFSLRLFVPLLCLIEPEGNREEKELTHDIGNFLRFNWHCIL